MIGQGDTAAPSISYDGFAKIWRDEEQLPPEQQTFHHLVDRFDGAGLVIKTAAKDPTSATQHKEPEGQVSKMAKHFIHKSRK